MRELSVALDALAVLSAEIGPAGPDLALAAGLAELSGARAVRVGLAEDGRWPRPAALSALRRGASRLELRMAPVPALVKTALEVRPDRVLLASEPGEGRHGALDLRAWGPALGEVVRSLGQAGLGVGVRIEPAAEAVKAVHAAGARTVELDAEALVAALPRERAVVLHGLAEAAQLALRLRMTVALAGGIGPASLPEMLAAVPGAARVTVGRAFVARAALVGVERATRDFVALAG